MERVCLFCRLATLSAARRPQLAASAPGKRQIQTRRGGGDDGGGDNVGAAAADGLEGVLTDYEASAPASRDSQLDPARRRVPQRWPKTARLSLDLPFGLAGEDSLVRFVGLEKHNQGPSLRVRKVNVFDGRRDADQGPLRVRKVSFITHRRILPNVEPAKSRPFTRRSSRSAAGPSPSGQSHSRGTRRPASVSLDSDLSNWARKAPYISPQRIVPHVKPLKTRPLVRRGSQLFPAPSLSRQSHSSGTRLPASVSLKWYPSKLPPVVQYQRSAPLSMLPRRVRRTFPLSKEPTLTQRRKSFRSLKRLRLIWKFRNLALVSHINTPLRTRRITTNFAVRYMRDISTRPSRIRYVANKHRVDYVQESKLRVNDLVQNLVQSAPASTQHAEPGTDLSSVIGNSVHSAPASTHHAQPERTEQAQPERTNPSPAVDRLMATAVSPSRRRGFVNRSREIRAFTTFARGADTQREAQPAGQRGNTAELEIQRLAARNSGFGLRGAKIKTPRQTPSLFQREKPTPSNQSGVEVTSLFSRPASTVTGDDWTSTARSREMPPPSSRSETQFKSLFGRPESALSNEKWTPAAPSQQRFAAAFGRRETGDPQRLNQYNPPSENWRQGSVARGAEMPFKVHYNRVRERAADHTDESTPRFPGRYPTRTSRPAQNFRPNEAQQPLKENDGQESSKEFLGRRKFSSPPKAHNPRLRVDKLLQDMQNLRSDPRHDNRKHTKRGRRRDEDEDDHVRYSERYRESDRDHSKKTRSKNAPRKQEEETKPQNQLKLPAHISVANLANVFGVRYEAFARTMKKLGFEDTRHDFVLSSEDAGLIAMEFGYQPVFDKSAVELVAAPWPEDKSSLPVRPPVVTIMGHVDHGKTTILDYLRKSSVAASEHGGITQHIGAFSVSLASGKKITFLDTPGHAAFLSMRQRGANVTDIVILVVAADDGVMPQTIEAIKHAQAAQVPIIVAVNKIDKQEKSITRIMQELARHNVEPEEYGGDTQVVHVSGKTGQGMPDLEEAIVTLSEILDHRAPPDGAVEGWILESAVKPQRGKVATVLVRRGTLRPGAVIVAGRAWARARTLRDHNGAVVPAAGPGMPVELDGWRERPAPGDEVLQAAGGERAAAAVVESRAALADMARMVKDVAAVNAMRQQDKGAAEPTGRGVAASRERHRDRAIDGVFVEKKPQQDPADAESGSAGVLDVHFVVKADVVGSVEAATNLIAGLGDGGRTVRAHVVRAEAGSVSESDVEVASCVAGGVVLAFNAEVEAGARELAARRGVLVLEHSVIYRIAEDVVRLMESRLPDIVSWRVLGEGLVFATDKYTVKGRRTKRIAGVKVKSGTLVGGRTVRVMRKAEVIYDGTILSLRHHKDVVSEVKKDSECGITFRDWDKFEVGDQLQVVEEVRERPKLSSDHMNT